MAATWVIGAVINIIGSILINLGTNVMKLGHNKRLAIVAAERPQVRTVREWQVGVLLFAVGNIMNFVSLGFAAQSILAALGSVQFVSNVLFAWLVLEEKATRRVCAATFCIVLGCIILVTYGNHQSVTLTVQDMLKYYESPVYISYLVVMGVTVVTMLLVYRRGSQKLAQHGREALHGGWITVLPVSYALFSGMLGTQSVVFCKSLSSLLRTTIAGDSQLASAFFWVLMALFIATATFWVTRLNKGLREFPSSVIVPMMQISWTMFSILSGGIYFHEYRVFTLLTGSMFALGVAVVCVGVFLLTPTKKAYLRYYRDLEVDLMHPDGTDSIELDTESLLPKVSDVATNGHPQPSVLQMPVASWGTKEGWVKQLGLAQLQSLLRPGVTGAAEEPARIPAAHVSVTVQGPARKDLVTVAGPPQTVLAAARLRTISSDPAAAVERGSLAGGKGLGQSQSPRRQDGWLPDGEAPLTPISAGPFLTGAAVVQPHLS